MTKAVNATAKELVMGTRPQVLSFLTPLPLLPSPLEPLALLCPVGCHREQTALKDLTNVPERGNRPLHPGSGVCATQPVSRGPSPQLSAEWNAADRSRPASCPEEVCHGVRVQREVQHGSHILHSPDLAQAPSPHWLTESSQKPSAGVSSPPLLC